ncbi:hypothetical protein EBR04_01600 [bacterium]|nr:hypothetical protein [bacterium]
MILDLADLKRTLQPVFTEQQTNTLATCLYEYYQPIVHQREMAAIRDTLKRVSESQDRLALAQERTEVRIERLTEAQERTEVRIGELTAAQVRSEARIDRLTAAQETMRADIEHLAEITKEVVWGIGDLRKQVGGIALSVGQGLEAYAMERIPALLEQQFGFTTRSSMPEFLGLPGDTSEIDVVYRGTREGRPVVVLCEVKTNITDAEVREFLEIVSRVRPSIAADDVRVLFFGYRAGESARRLITEYDALLAFPRGLVVS